LYYNRPSKKEEFPVFAWHRQFSFFDIVMVQPIGSVISQLLLSVQPIFCLNVSSKKPEQMLLVCQEPKFLKRFSAVNKAQAPEIERHQTAETFAPVNSFWIKMRL